MTDPLDGLCDYHELVIARCLAKAGHQDDSAVADRLRSDTARYACSPEHCNVRERNDS